MKNTIIFISELILTQNFFLSEKILRNLALFYHEPSVQERKVAERMKEEERMAKVEEQVSKFKQRPKKNRG